MRWKSFGQSDNSLEEYAYHARGVSRTTVHFGRVQVVPQAAYTLFVNYICDSIALRFKPFKIIYENGSKIALDSTCGKGF